MPVILGNTLYEYNNYSTDTHYNISPSLDRFAVEYWFPYVSDGGLTLSNGTYPAGFNLPVETVTYGILSNLNTSLLTTDIVPAYFNDYYFRIHVLPNPYALGVVLTDQNLTVEVWNTFFVDNPISGITSTNPDGITIFNALGTATYKPLDHRIYNISVPAQGAATIDAILNIGFTYGDGRIYITGTRALLFPFPPNNGYSEDIQWLTDIIPSIASEEVLQLRDIPRVTLGYDYYLRTVPEFSLAKNIAKSYNAKQLATPIWAQITRLTNINAGTTTISLDTTYLELEANDIAIIYSNYSFYEIVDILSLTVSSITFKLPISNSFSICYFMPLRIGIMPSNLDFKRDRASKNKIQVKFQLTDYYVSTSIASMEQYLSLPVISKESIIQGELTEQFTIKTEFLDFDMGDVQPIVIENYTRHRQNLSLVARGQKEIFTLKRFLDYLKGKNSYFFLPTFSNDCIPNSPNLSSGSNNISVVDTKLALLPPKYIRIIGSTIINMQIASIVGSGANEIITFTSNAPQTVNNITSIQIMTKCRADSDNFQLTYDVTSQKNITMFTTIPVIEVL